MSFEKIIEKELSRRGHTNPQGKLQEFADGYGVNYPISQQEYNTIKQGMDAEINVLSDGSDPSVITELRQIQNRLQVGMQARNALSLIDQFGKASEEDNYTLFGTLQEMNLTKLAAYAMKNNFY